MRIQHFAENVGNAVEFTGSFKMGDVARYFFLKLIKLDKTNDYSFWGGKFDWHYSFFINKELEEKVQKILSTYEMVDRIEYNKLKLILAKQA